MFFCVFHLNQKKKYARSVLFKRVWNEVLKIKPDCLSVLNNLSWIKNRKGFHDPNEAIVLAQRASENSQYNNPGQLDILSCSYCCDQIY